MRLGWLCITQACPYERPMSLPDDLCLFGVAEEGFGDVFSPFRVVFSIYVMFSTYVMFWFGCALGLRCHAIWLF